jgi:uncharacterized membrane protein
MNGDNLHKLDQPSIGEVANEVQPPESSAINKEGSIEKGNIPPEPVLAPQIGFWETIQALVSLKMDQAIVDGLDGKPMNLPTINPLAIAGIGSKFWKVVAAILFAGLAVLLGWQFLKTKIQKSA